jgi:glycine/D-amino acid oxidase-like deaminating enzyme
MGFTAGNEKISAKHTIIAAGCFSAQIQGAERYAPVRPAKGQMISLRCPEAKIERVLWGDDVYLVPRNDGRILAGATVEYAGFDKTLTAGGQRKLLNAAIDLVPPFEKAQVEETWVWNESAKVGIASARCDSKPRASRRNAPVSFS